MPSKRRIKVGRERTPPTTPTLSAVAVSTSQIDLSWTASSDASGVAGYVLQRSTDQSNWTTIFSDDKLLVFNDSGLSASTRYYYRLRAVDTNGNYSSYATANTITNSESTGTFDYYISPTGSNSNDGLTTGTPWAITALNGTTKTIANKRIGLMDGYYHLGGLTPADASSEGRWIDLTQTGVTVEAVNPRAAILTAQVDGGAITTNNSWDMVCLTGANQTLKNVRFTNIGAGALRIRGTNLLISGCQFDTQRAYSDKGNNPGCVRSGSFGSYATFTNCYFHDIRLDPAFGGDYRPCVGPLYNYTNITVEYCTFTASTGGAFYPKRNTGSYIFRFNKVDGAGGIVVMKDFNRIDDAQINDFGAFYAYDKHVPIVHNNLILIAYVLDDGSTQIGQDDKGCEFYNNTLIEYGSATNGGVWFHTGNNDGSSCGPTWKYYNNIHYRRAGASINGGWNRMHSNEGVPTNWPDRVAVVSGELVWNYNGYSPFLNTNLTTSWSTPAAMFAAVGVEDPAKTIAADPLFVNAAGSNVTDYVLQAGSSMKNAGRVGGISTGATTDMGCWGNGATQIGCDFA